MADRLLADLNDPQREAVTTAATPLAILAGAGSGKTLVLTRRIAWQAEQGNLDPSRVLALTFTRKAAGELGARLRQLGIRETVAAGTFHALALAQLRKRWADQGQTPPQLLERKVGLLVRTLGRGKNLVTQAADLAGEIEWAKARLIRPEQYVASIAKAGRTPPLPATQIASAYQQYEEEKKRRGLVDFDDLLWQCAEAIETDPQFAAAQRWRFRHFFVDEYQDVNPAHVRLLGAWLGDRSDLCVVGDDDQAIYSFAGADASHLTDFRHHFPEASVVRLETNYRSTPQILGAASSVLPGGMRTKQHMRAVLGDGPIPTITAYPDEAQEARAIARQVRDAHAPGVPWSSMAVLYRTNAQSVRFEEALLAAGIPVRVRGAARFLDRKEVRSALDQVRVAMTSAPGTSLVSQLADLRHAAEQNAAGSPGSTDHPDENDERAEHLGELERLAREYAAADGGTGSFEGFLAYLTTSLHDHDPIGDAVELLTFHRAKGLEWSTVFVTGMEQGLVPISHAKTPAAYSEERRLVYVALSRAMRSLHLSWAQQRTFGRGPQARKPSPYLSLIEAALRAFETGGDGDWQTLVTQEKDRIAQLRASVQAARPRQVGAGADPQVMTALVDWRRGLARASGVPAFVIFHDATLAAVAEAKPASREALLALPGLGPVKVERYGDALLDLLRLHAS